MDNKQKVIIFLLVLNLIVVGYFGITIRNHVINKNEHLRSEISSLRSDVFNLEHRLSNSIEDILEQNKNRVNHVQYCYKEIDSDAKNAVITYTFELESVSSNSKVYVVYSPQDSTQVVEAELKKVNGLTYEADVELSLDHNYEFDILERSDDGAETLLNTRKEYQPLYDEFYTYRIAMQSRGTSRSNQSYEQSMLFSVKDFGIDDYAIDTMNLEVYYEGKLIDEKDITNDIVSGSDQEAIEQYHMALASGEVEVSVTESEYVEMKKSNVRSDETRDTYYYNYKLDYSDYPDLKMSKDSYEQPQLKVTITCKDGFSHVIGSETVEHKVIE